MPLHPLLRSLARNRQFQRLLITVGPVAARELLKLAESGKLRQLAIRHADTVVDGRVSKEHVDGELRWVVWSGERPLAAYPPVSADLAKALEFADPDKRRAPEELPLRRALRAASDFKRATADRRHREDPSSG
jgi:hypothetical protein